MTVAEKYVTAAYCMILAVVAVYVLIIELKLQRLQREVKHALTTSRLPVRLIPLESPQQPTAANATEDSLSPKQQSGIPRK